MKYTETTIYLDPNGKKFIAIALPCKPTENEINLSAMYSSFVRGGNRVHVLASSKMHPKWLLWFALEWINGKFAVTSIDSLR
jgi:hypothetical protein